MAEIAQSADTTQLCAEVGKNKLVAQIGAPPDSTDPLPEHD